MRDLSELTLHFQPEHYCVTLEGTGKDGIREIKQITLDAFLDCIKGSIREKPPSSGLLPPHCLSYMGDAEGRTLTLWYPERYADVTYYDTLYPHFPLPRLVFGFQLTLNGRVSDCRVAVAADETPSSGTKLYQWPFSNMRSWDRMCLGANPLPKYPRLAALATLPNYLLMLPNNDDTYDKRNNKLGLGYRELLEHLKDKEPDYYYGNILCPNGRTLQNFIEGDN